MVKKTNGKRNIVLSHDNIEENIVDTTMNLYTNKSGVDVAVESTSQRKELDLNCSLEICSSSSLLLCLLFLLRLPLLLIIIPSLYLKKTKRMQCMLLAIRVKNLNWSKFLCC